MGDGVEVTEKQVALLRLLESHLQDQTMLATSEVAEQLGVDRNEANVLLMWSEEIGVSSVEAASGDGRIHMPLPRVQLVLGTLKIVKTDYVAKAWDWARTHRIPAGIVIAYFFLGAAFGFFGGIMGIITLLSK